VNSKQPHDTLFRRAFADPRSAVALVRSALLRHPELRHLVPLVAWDGLKPIQATVVDAADKLFLTDHLFEAPVRLADRTELSLLFVPILEHKRQMDKDTAWQSIRYQVRTIEWQRSQPERHNSWPIVITIVIYHGDEPWTAARDLREMFSIPASLSDVMRDALLVHLPGSRYVLHDLREEPDEWTGANGLPLPAFLTLQFLKHLPNADQSELAAHLKRLKPHIAELSNLPNGKAFLGFFHWYLMNTSDLKLSDIDDLYRSTVIPDVCDSLLTPFERYVKQKIEAGRAEGLAEGRAESARTTLRNLLERRFGPLAASHLQRIDSAPQPALDRWLLRVLDEPTIEAVLSD
jgi:hypothetical protein